MNVVSVSPEVLFQQVTGKGASGIQGISFQIKCDVDICKDLYANVVASGDPVSAWRGTDGVGSSYEEDHGGFSTWVKTVGMDPHIFICFFVFLSLEKVQSMGRTLTSQKENGTSQSDIPRCKCAQPKWTLKRRSGRNIIHFTADSEIIELMLRTIH